MTWPSLDQGRLVSGWGEPNGTSFKAEGDVVWRWPWLHFCHHFSSFFSLSLQKLAIWVSTFAILTASPSSYPWFGELRLDLRQGGSRTWPKFRNHWGGRDESEKSVETKLLSLVSLVFRFVLKQYIVWHHFGSLSDPSPAGFCRLHPRHSRCFRPICAQTNTPILSRGAKFKNFRVGSSCGQRQWFVAETAPSLDLDPRGRPTGIPSF